MSKRGVEVHSVANLHAKVYVFGRTAVVTSANVSASSEKQLVEAACEFNLPEIVAQCRGFILGLRGEIVELKFARDQIPLWHPPMGPYRVRTSRSPKRIQQSPIIAVGIDEVDDFDAEDSSAFAKARLKARRRIPN